MEYDREMSDIGKRFRKKAGLTTEEIEDKCDKLHPDFTHVYRLAYMDGVKDGAQAQLNKALSTELDGRYVLALIDTKGELPPKVPRLRHISIVFWWSG